MSIVMKRNKVSKTRSYFPDSFETSSELNSIFVLKKAIIIMRAPDFLKNKKVNVVSGV